MLRQGAISQQYADVKYLKREVHAYANNAGNMPATVGSRKTIVYGYFVALLDPPPNPPCSYEINLSALSS